MVVYAWRAYRRHHPGSSRKQPQYGTIAQLAKMCDHSWAEKISPKVESISVALWSYISIYMNPMPFECH